jgi:hypothetical protein
MKHMVFTNISAARRMTGLSYLGSVASSSKIAKGLQYNEATYILYLSPANSSGYEVCPMRTKECTEACLHESGHNRIDTKNNRINKSRVAKTKLFFEHREFFMAWLIAEITKAKVESEMKGFRFSVRLNGTSDIDPTLFRYNGSVLFDIFSDVKFYDYTKVSKRFKLLSRYPNYDLTYSYTGYNMVECVNLLDNQVSRIAMVFEGKKLPIVWSGYKVIDGDAYDMRYLDDAGVIVGLKYKKVRNKIDTKNNPFIISENSIFSVYE